MGGYGREVRRREKTRDASEEENVSGPDISVVLGFVLVPHYGRSTPGPRLPRILHQDSTRVRLGPVARTQSHTPLYLVRRKIPSESTAATHQHPLPVADALSSDPLR